MSPAYFQALIYSDDLLSLPQRLIYTLSKQQNVDALIPMAIRAMVVGVLFAVVRRVIKYTTARITQILYPTTYIAYTDPSYSWITSWIAQDVYAQSQIHDFQLSTIDSKSLKKKNKSTLISSQSPGPSGENGSGGGRVGIHNSSWEKREVIGHVLPTYHPPIRIRHNGNYLWVTRRINGFAGSRSIEHLRIQTIAFRPKPQTAIAGGGGGGGGGKHDLAPSTVTMSGLLNAIDGVSSQEGCVLVATTNHPNRLDPALSRAGRFDVKLEFGYAIPLQARELYLHFYPLEDFQDSSSLTSSQARSKDEDEKTTKIQNTEKVEADKEDEDVRLFIEDQQELENLADKFVKNVFDDYHVQDQQLEIGASDKMDGHNGDEKATSTLSESDKSGNPKTSTLISMASLQSYLLQYKEDPISACDNQNIRKWLDNEKAVKANESGKSNLRGLQGGGKQDEDFELKLEDSLTARMKRKSKGHTKSNKTKSKSIQEERKKKKNDEDERGDIAEKVKVDPGQGNDDKVDIVEAKDEHNVRSGIKSGCDSN
ncbi:hypothetical protein V865_008163 [Kwoniella europaea PYCC6329]|uniref:BCS1 N-terminal domain-containing protein n=1 Tax=Kwoniella europaea PYCC6329 TaxID=1423913 RepID=A0AAX4KWR3_9TREE